MSHLNIHELTVSVSEEGDEHVTVLLEPAHWPNPEDERAVEIPLDEWNHARIYHAGVIARVAAYVHYEVRDRLACCTVPHTGCRTSFGGGGTSLLNPNGDWEDIPWVEFTVPRTAKKALITLVKDALQIVGACDSRTFTEAEEQAWQEGAS